MLVRKSLHDGGCGTQPLRFSAEEGWEAKCEPVGPTRWPNASLHLCRRGEHGTLLVATLADDTDVAMLLRVGGPHPQTSMFERSATSARVWIAPFSRCLAGTVHPVHDARPAPTVGAHGGRHVARTAGVRRAPPPKRAAAAAGGSVELRARRRRAARDTAAALRAVSLVVGRADGAGDAARPRPAADAAAAPPLPPTRAARRGAAPPALFALEHRQNGFLAKP